MFTDVAVFTSQVWLFQFAFLERQSVSTQVYFSLVCSISKIHSILFVFVVCIMCNSFPSICTYLTEPFKVVFWGVGGGGGGNKSTGSVFAVIQMSFHNGK